MKTPPPEGLEKWSRRLDTEHSGILLEKSSDHGRVEGMYLGILFEKSCLNSSGFSMDYSIKIRISFPGFRYVIQEWNWLQKRSLFLQGALPSLLRNRKSSSWFNGCLGGTTTIVSCRMWWYDAPIKSFTKYFRSTRSLWGGVELLLFAGGNGHSNHHYRKHPDKFSLL